MAFSFEYTGLDEVMQAMEGLEKKGQEIASAGLYEGAGVVADKVSSAINGIRTAPFKYVKDGTRLPSPEEKAILAASRHGVAKFKKSPVRVDTSVGFQNSGYAAIPWNHSRSNSRTKYKVSGNKARHASKGGGGASSKPVPVIANAINSGTSFMRKQPFFRKAFSQSQGQAEAVIEAKIESEIDNLNIE